MRSKEVKEKRDVAFVSGIGAIYFLGVGITLIAAAAFAQDISFSAQVVSVIFAAISGPLAGVLATECMQNLMAIKQVR